jgi:hypothetical protein
MFAIFKYGDYQSTLFCGSTEEQRLCEQLLACADLAIQPMEWLPRAAQSQAQAAQGAVALSAENGQRAQGTVVPAAENHHAHRCAATPAAEKEQWEKMFWGWCNSCKSDFRKGEVHICTGKRPRPIKRGVALFDGIAGMSTAMREVRVPIVKLGISINWQWQAMVSAALALLQAGLQIEKQIEISMAAQRVLKDMFEEVEKGFDVRYMPLIECHVDFCSITFPCHGTSQAGPRTGMKLTGNPVKVMHEAFMTAMCHVCHV